MRSLWLCIICHLWLVGAVSVPGIDTLRVTNHKLALSDLSQSAPPSLSKLRTRANGDGHEGNTNDGHKQKKPDVTNRDSMDRVLRIDAALRHQISQQFTHIKLMQVVFDDESLVFDDESQDSDGPHGAVQELHITFSYDAVSKLDHRLKAGSYTNDPDKWPAQLVASQPSSRLSRDEFRLDDNGWQDPHTEAEVGRLLPIDLRRVNGMTVSKVVAALQASRLPYLTAQVKEGPWDGFIIRNYQVPPAGLSSGFCYQIEPNARDPPLAGWQGVFMNILNPKQIVPMDPRKNGYFRRNPWGWGKDNRNSPRHIGPFTWNEYLREGDRLVKTMGNGYYRRARLVQIDFKHIEEPLVWSDRHVRSIKCEGPTLLYKWHDGDQEWLLSFGTNNPNMLQDVPWSSRDRELWWGWDRVPAAYPYHSTAAKTRLHAALWTLQGSGRPAFIDLQSQDISMTLSAAIALWKLSIYPTSRLTHETVHLLQTPYHIHPDVDNQVLFYFPASLEILASRTGAAMKRSLTTSKWELVHPGTINPEHPQNENFLS